MKLHAVFFDPSCEMEIILTFVTWNGASTLPSNLDGCLYTDKDNLNLSYYYILKKKIGRNGPDVVVLLHTRKSV
jgi:hypothetical protein